jgi:hypothetical protein
VLIKFYLLLVLRLQWCRSRARTFRWWEEVCILEEEMRRVLAYLTWYMESWTRASELIENVDPEDSALLEGQKAYALRQAHIRFSLEQHFSSLWHDVASWTHEGKIPNQNESDETDDDD